MKYGEITGKNPGIFVPHSPFGGRQRREMETRNRWHDLGMTSMAGGATVTVRFPLPVDVGDGMGLQVQETDQYQQSQRPLAERGAAKAEVPGFAISQH